MVRGLNQMPPTSTNRIDHRGAELVAEWIRHLNTQPKLAATERRLPIAEQERRFLAAERERQFHNRRTPE